MPKFIVHYTKIVHCNCEVEAQNEKQVEHLFDAELIDFDNENCTSTDQGELKSIQKGCGD